MAKTESAKAAFPTKACPKCGEPIHARKTKHEECGWAAEAMPGAARATKPKAAAAANGKKVSKMEAVRNILAESGNDIMPADIQVQLKKGFKIKMGLPMISNYKSVILKRSGKKKLGRPKGSTNAVKAAPAAVVASRVSSAISVEDIRAVKKLIDAIGADKVKELAGVLAN